MTAAVEFLHLPAVGDRPSRGEIERWFGNIAYELRALPLATDERESFARYYRDAGMLANSRRRFFYHHYAGPLVRAVRELFAAGPRPRILDLGCGTGTQSLLFALLGAEVIGVDLDGAALDVFRQRKAFYEKHAARALDISIRQGNAFELDFSTLGPLQGVYSLFAFNLMQPTSGLLGLLRPHMAETGVMVIQDGNRKHFYNRVFRRRAVASRDELRAALHRIGFNDVLHIGGYAIPPPFWRFLPTDVLEPIDRYLASHEPLAVSYLHIARK